MATYGPNSVDKKRGNSANTSNGSEMASDTSQNEQVKELLLCLRPIRDGENKIGSKFKFIPTSKSQQDATKRANDATDGHNLTAKSAETSRSRPMKKRPLPSSDFKDYKKKPPLDKSGSEAEKSVVESLILMSNHQGQTN